LAAFQLCPVRPTRYAGRCLATLHVTKLCSFQQAIVLCLDLSESMNKRSGVSRSAIPAPNEKEYDPDVESVKAVETLVKDLPDSLILLKGECRQMRNLPHLTSTLSQDVFG